jgi:Asp-tRNA(Asn)/Glu-tRNA(Gln) amidotransferase A subunit family amidase
MTGLWSYAGLPCVSLPAGFARNGLPLGLQLVAPFGADERLVAWATSLQSLLQSYGFGMPSREKYAGRPL